MARQEITKTQFDKSHLMGRSQQDEQEGTRLLVGSLIRPPVETLE